MNRIKQIINEVVEDFVLRTSKGNPIKRYQNNVGKLMGSDLYVHKNYVGDVLSPDQLANYQKLNSILENHISQTPQLRNFEPTIIKYNLKNDSVSFLMSRDFDTADEPTINGSIMIKNDGTISYRKEGRNPTIYHHKWTMVKDDYPGFNVADSKERSRKWLALTDLDPSKYGRKDYWEKEVVPRIK